MADERGSPAVIEHLAWRVREALASSTPEDEQPAETAPAAEHEGLPEPLTDRELDVLRLIAAGRSNREIGDELFLAVSTVKWYAGQIFAKLDARNRTEAVARAREVGLIT
jgi:LuxR family maltose regulon positive regulatory protein